MYDLIMEQKEEFKKAICGGNGEYEICDEYKEFEVSHSQWLRMTPEQRDIKINRAMMAKDFGQCFK